MELSQHLPLLFRARLKPSLFRLPAVTGADLSLAAYPDSIAQPRFMAVLSPQDGYAE
ncbi:hypothetical protein ACLQ24_08135 [Micromonospora sp. DT4]|uniref:hypothetical protein n=1 Tax=Micromonospora sp. DT4 TaxID=3393438 RepID=UPI003CFA6A87